VRRALGLPARCANEGPCLVLVSVRCTGANRDQGADLPAAKGQGTAAARICEATT